MFNQANPDNHGQLTTLSLRDDPEPAMQRAREQTSREGFARLISGIGLVVVLALLYVVFNDYVAHKQEIRALIARGRRIPAQLSGEPVQVRGRYRYTPQWRVGTSYTVDGRAHAGRCVSVRPPGVHCRRIRPAESGSPQGRGFDGTFQPGRTTPLHARRGSSRLRVHHAGVGADRVAGKAA